MHGDALGSGGPHAKVRDDKELQRAEHGGERQPAGVLSVARESLADAEVEREAEVGEGGPRAETEVDVLRVPRGAHLHGACAIRSGNGI